MISFVLLCPFLGTFQADLHSGFLGSCLHFTNVEDWGLTVFAHTKACDFHVRVAQCNATGEKPMLIEPVENGALYMPMADDDADNFIVGMAVDLTSTQVNFLVAIN